MRAAVAGIAHLLAPDSVVLLLVNGMGLAEQLQRGLATSGYLLRHQHRGRLHASPRSISATPAAVRPASGDRGSSSRHPGLAQWAGAIDSVHLGRAYRDGAVVETGGQLHHQSADRRARLSLTANWPGAGSWQRKLRRCVRKSRTSAVRRATPMSLRHCSKAWPRVIAGTADNRSSMLQDVERGRRTEIDYITGYLLQVAEQHGIDAPHNRACWKP